MHTFCTSATSLPLFMRLAHIGDGAGAGVERAETAGVGVVDTDTDAAAEAGADADADVAAAAVDSARPCATSRHSRITSAKCRRNSCERCCAFERAYSVVRSAVSVERWKDVLVCIEPSSRVSWWWRMRSRNCMME